MPIHPIELADKLVRSGDKYRYRLDLQYDGTEFSGMQWQPRKRTVQKCLEDALEILFCSKVRVITSSRTDAGVHAERQVVHFDSAKWRRPSSIVRACNVTLPPDIRIVHAEEVDAGFHARFSAKWRAYRYQIAQVPVAIGRQFVWQYFKQVDTPRLCSLAGVIIGNHNFTAFAHESPTEKHNYECTVYRSEWRQVGDLLQYEIDASRYVHGMVRMLVGTMIDIASGHENMLDFDKIMKSMDNRFAGTKAPASGLTLSRIAYREWPDF